MTRENEISIGGTVTDVFAHRVVVENHAGRWLADLGPASTDIVALATGMHIVLTGKMKPSELKAETVSIGDGPVLSLRAVEEANPHDNGADPDAALSSAKSGGYSVIALPRRKPKHFEILARDSAGNLVELHIEFDGSIRKTKSIDHSAPKWAGEFDRH